MSNIMKMGISPTAKYTATCLADILLDTIYVGGDYVHGCVSQTILRENPLVESEERYDMVEGAMHEIESILEANVTEMLQGIFGNLPFSGAEVFAKVDQINETLTWQALSHETDGDFLYDCTFVIEDGEIVAHYQ